MKRWRLATVWLSGCSGCHMSLLNLHEGLLEMLHTCDLVYSPLVDTKEFPEEVDITVVEGAVGTEADRELAILVRERSDIVISLGDCACSGNVSALRNPLHLPVVELPTKTRSETLPRLLPLALPLHQVIRVDGFITGCPPTPEAIKVGIIEHLAEITA